MSLEIHRDCKERLVASLSQHLETVTVSNKKFLDRQSAIPIALAEEVLPGQGNVKDQLDKYIGELPLFDFVYEQLCKELYEGQAYEADTGAQALSEIDGYENNQATAQRLIDDLDSLPWAYCLTLQFHNEISEEIFPILQNFTVCDELSFVKPDDIFLDEFPLTTGDDNKDSDVA